MEPRLTAAVPARAALAGNPADLYGGAVLAVPVDRLTARVTVTSADRIRVTGPALRWRDVGHLVDATGRFGHDGADRLVTAAIATLARHGGRDAAGGDAFALRWSTTIPRSVGLAGSSALIVAVIRVLATRWGLALGPDEVACLALSAERDELAVPAGLQDRAVQAHGCPVLVDGDVVTPIAPPRPVSLALAWRADAAQPSGAVHDRPAPSEHVIAALSDAARDAAHAIGSGSTEGLQAAMARSFAARRAAGLVDHHTAAMVDAVARAGLVANTAGSGGSIVFVVERGEGTRAVAALAPLGASVLRVRL